ncbi:MAG: hypothetical protein LBD60_04060 [Puniceicoccales bacterium]|jgi:hypothetical protein|nr:hypothetical protein [Puniceicoccales bacterium]
MNNTGSKKYVVFGRSIPTASFVKRADQTLKMQASKADKAATVTIGKELGKGGFGVVQAGTVTDSKGDTHQIAIKEMRKVTKKCYPQCVSDRLAAMTVDCLSMDKSPCL